MMEWHKCINRECRQANIKDQILQNKGKCPGCDTTIFPVCKNKKCENYGNILSEKLSSTPQKNISRIDHKYKCPMCGEEQELYEHGPLE